MVRTHMMGAGSAGAILAASISLGPVAGVQAAAPAPSIYPPASVYRLPARVLGPHACLPIDGGCQSFLRWYDNGEENGEIGGTFEAFQVYEYAVTPLGFPPPSGAWYAKGFYQVHIYDVPQVAQQAEGKHLAGHAPADAVNATERMQGGYNFRVDPSAKSCTYMDGWLFRNVVVSINVEVSPVHPPCVKSARWIRTASHALYAATVAYAAAHPDGD